jgi:hypothetical protein
MGRGRRLGASVSRKRLMIACARDSVTVVDLPVATIIQVAAHFGNITIQSHDLNRWRGRI